MGHRYVKERCDSDAFTLEYTTSADMVADIFTKGFTDIERRRRACSQIRIGLDEAAIKALVTAPPPPASDGGPRALKNAPRGPPKKRGRAPWGPPQNRGRLRAPETKVRRQ